VAIIWTAADINLCSTKMLRAALSPAAGPKASRRYPLYSESKEMLGEINKIK
jgi:hypothetical protein